MPIFWKNSILLNLIILFHKCFGQKKKGEGEGGGGIIDLGQSIGYTTWELYS